MIGWITTLLTGNGLMIALCLGALAMFWTYDSSRVETGRQAERAKVEQANRKAASVADTVRNKSRRMRGKLDPHTID